MNEEYKKAFNTFSKKLREMCKREDLHPKDCEYIYYVRDENKHTTDLAVGAGLSIPESLSQMFDAIILGELYFHYADDIKEGKYPSRFDIYQFWGDILNNMDKLNVMRFYDYDPDVFWKDYLANYIDKSFEEYQSDD